MPNPIKLSERLARWLVGHPKTVGLLLLVFIVSSLGALPWLKFQTGMDPWVDREVPEQALLDQLGAKFVSDEVIFVAYRAPDVFSSATLGAVRRLGAELERVQVPSSSGKTHYAIEEVTSLATIKDVDGADMTFRAVPLVPDPVPTRPSELSRVRQRALNNPIVAENLLSRSEPRQLAAMLLRLNKDLNDDATAVTVAKVREVLRAAEKALPSTSFFVTGKAPLRADVAAYMKRDLQRLIPLDYVLVIVAMFIFARRFLGVAFALFNVTLCTIAGMASLVLARSGINNLSSMMSPVMAVLSVAAVIHFLAEYAHNLREHGAQGALERTLAELMLPMTMCQITTAVGFASLSVSRIPAMHEFGIAAALAVMASLAISFLSMALLGKLIPPHRLVSLTAMPGTGRFDALMQRYASFVIRNARPLLLANAVVLVLAAIGMTRLEANEDMLKHFSHELPIRRSTELVNQHMGGVNDLVLSIRSDKEEHFLEPQALKKLEALSGFLRQEIGTEVVTSMADYVKLMNRGFNDNAREAYRIPDTREQVAQLLLLNGDDMLFDYVDRTYRWVRVVARSQEHGSRQLAQLYRKIDRYLAQEFGPEQGYEAAGSGDARLGARLSQDIIDSQTKSIGLALLLIFGPIFLMFRSWRAAAYAVPSNLAPVVLTLGLMGWTGLPLNIATTMIATVVLGIAVDDTIHFIQYMRLRLAEHGDLERALREACAIKGVSAIWIALIMGLGFAITVVSNFYPTRNFGVLTAAAMIAGVTAELFLLPPLMVVMRTRLGVRPVAAPALRAQEAPKEAA